MQDESTDDKGAPAPTPPLYQGKGDSSQPLPPGAGWTYLAERGEWMVDLNAEKRRAEEHAAEVRRWTAPEWPGELPSAAREAGPWTITLFDGELHVSFSQVYVQSHEVTGEAGREHSIDDHFAGQHNGLCGGAIPGRLCLMTATHTGEFPLSVELHPAPPPLDERWEDVVELSFHVETWRVAILPLMADRLVPLTLPRGRYRLRCCASGMASGEHRAPTDGEERYLWQFWRSPEHEPDRIVKVGSERARWLHATYGGQAQLPGATDGPGALRRAGGGRPPETGRFTRWTVMTPAMATQRHAEHQALRQQGLAQPWPGALPAVVATPGPWRIGLFDGRPWLSHHQIREPAPRPDDILRLGSESAREVHAVQGGQGT